MKYNIITENWNKFLREETAPARPPQVDGSKPQEVLKLLTPYINKSQGQPGPDSDSLKAIKSEQGQKILAALKVSKNPVEAAKLITNLFTLLSDEDKAEIATIAAKLTQAAQKAPATPKPKPTSEPPVAAPTKIVEVAPIITQTKGSATTTKTAKPIITQTKGSSTTPAPTTPTPTPAEPAKLVEKTVTDKINGFANKGLINLGGGDPLKGMKILASGPFIIGMGMAFANMGTGNLMTGVTDIANNIFRLINTMKADSLAQILDLQMDAIMESKDSISLIERQLQNATLDDGTPVCPACLLEIIELTSGILFEAKYQGRTVSLNKPMKGDVKKSKVYVKDPKTGNIKKVNFGDKNMTIKKNIPARRKSFRARHKCDQKKDKTSAGYWSCKAWE